MQSSFWVLEFVVSYVPGNKNRTIVNHVQGKYTFSYKGISIGKSTPGCLVGGVCGVFIVRHCLTLKSFCKESDCRILMIEFFVKFREEFTHVSVSYIQSCLKSRFGHHILDRCYCFKRISKSDRVGKVNWNLLGFLMMSHYHLI